MAAGRADLPADALLSWPSLSAGTSAFPVPSLPIYPLTFLFGGAVPDGILMLLYALTAFFALAGCWAAGWRPGFRGHAFFFSASSSMLPLLLTGAVWYQAQVLACAHLPVDRISARTSATQGLLCYALAVGCRPFNALYGPLLMLIYLSEPGKMALPRLPPAARGGD